MNLLQVFFIVAGYLIFLIAIDVAKKQRVSGFQFFVFTNIGLGLLIFTLLPNTLQALGDIFWVQRGADVLVYGSIVFLLYFVLELLNGIEKNKEDMTRLIREIALQTAEWKLSDKSDVVFIVPSYNEWKVIEKTLQSIFDAGYINCIVIDDGSRDNSGTILKKMEKTYPHMIVLHHYKNRWQGAGLESGFEFLRRNESNIEFVVTYDADGQHNIDDLPKFLEKLKANKQIEVALGSRFLEETTKSNIPLTRKLLLKAGILFTYLISQIHLSDTHNGYRVLRRSALDKIQITMDGMGHASEIIDIIAQKKIPFVEIPVHINYDEYAIGKWQRSSNAINIALHMIWKKFF